jgi:hypothetical protein
VSSQPIEYGSLLRKLSQQATDRAQPRARLPILGIDECANHPEVRSVASQAAREGELDRVVDLWYQLRRREDGPQIQIAGKFVRRAFPADFDLGTPVKGHSWPDAHVVLLLLGQFGASDRVILTSENTNKDRDGLRRILEEQVRPVLNAAEFSELGLLAYMKRGRTSWNAYAHSLLERIRSTGVSPRYEYLEV